MHSAELMIISCCRRRRHAVENNFDFEIYETLNKRDVNGTLPGGIVVDDLFYQLAIFRKTA